MQLDPPYWRRRAPTVLPPCAREPQAHPRRVPTTHLMPMPKVPFRKIPAFVAQRQAVGQKAPAKVSELPRLPNHAATFRSPARTPCTAYIRQQSKPCMGSEPFPSRPLPRPLDANHLLQGMQGLGQVTLVGQHFIDVLVRPRNLVDHAFVLAADAVPVR